jgi:hypothetical protein
LPQWHPCSPRRRHSPGREADDGAGNVDDRAPITELTRGLPVDHERAAHVGPLLGVERFEVVVSDWTDDHLPCGVHHDVDTPERLDGLGEQPLDVELVRDVGADARAMPSAARISSTAASA